MAPQVLGDYLTFFEQQRHGETYDKLMVRDLTLGKLQTKALLGIFDNRASSRVTDVTSVLSRDVILWIFFAARCEQTRAASVSRNLVDRIRSAFDKSGDSDAAITVLVAEGWDTPV
jgi:hypothetical protein